MLAACSMMTQLAIGQSVDEAYLLTGKEVVAAFDRLCGNLADLLHARERTAEQALGEVVG
jgi:NifU-like protein involved in Fe-S cluster formation